MLLGIGLVLAAGVVAWRLLRTPRDDRPWIPDQARVVTARFDGDRVHLGNIRDADPRTRAPAYIEGTYDLAALDSVWLVVAPFSENWRGPAHTFVTFGFGDAKYLAISVEARREVGEEYGVVAGALDRFEVLYVVGTERDLIGRRIFDAEGPTYLYPIRATPAAIRTLFTDMVARAASLKEHPEYYNTFTNNCTSNLLHHVQPLLRDRIPTTFVTLLPGYADGVAKKLDLIADDADITTARDRYRVDGRGRPALDSADFSQVIRRIP
ncbi:MAG TPA: DUF4105 domain-containing protein [Gemmatimonadales bacterium]|nr:DUF4105 domain-containing protein [Gemmatimonadales bacterium]